MQLLDKCFFLKVESILSRFIVFRNENEAVKLGFKANYIFNDNDDIVN